MNVFLDASAFTKRYVNEAGSDRVQEISLAASSIGVCVICLTEVTSALCRLRREGFLSEQQYNVCKQSLIQDVQDASVIHITNEIITRAVELLERWPLRSSDALNIACAAEWGADLFASADVRQCTAARAYGIDVEALAVN